MPLSAFPTGCDGAISPPNRAAYVFAVLAMRPEGLEPPRVAPQDPKSCASTSSATVASIRAPSRIIRRARTSSKRRPGQPGDLVLLGSRTLEGLNFRVEPVTRQLVDAGPAPAATAA